MQGIETTNPVKVFVKRGGFGTNVAWWSHRAILKVHLKSDEKPENHQEPEVKSYCEKAHKETVRSLMVVEFRTINFFDFVSIYLRNFSHFWKLSTISILKSQNKFYFTFKTNQWMGQTFKVLIKVLIWIGITKQSSIHITFVI